MGPFFRRKRLPRELAERLRVAAALAGEQVLEKHVRAALELIDEGAGRAPVERLLATYARLHHLGDGAHRQLRERVLATLGRDAGTLGRHPELEAPRSPFRRIARRVRGRVHHDLRAWIEQHTARVELTLLETHTVHALDFVRLLTGHLDTDQAIAAYADAVGLRSAIAEIVRLKVLRALHDEARPATAEPLHPRSASLPALRIADHG